MPAFDPHTLSDARILAAYLIFFGSYVVFAIGTFPRMKIDRPGAAIIGAVLMVAFGVVNARDALATIDFATIVLLFSMMLIVAHLRLAGFFDWITELAIERLHPHLLLPVVIVASGVFSAFLVNDIVCLVMTPFVVQLTRRLRVPPLPYLIAVATASNVGSTATITGNPQNMLIGSLSGISYVAFAARLAPVALAGLVVTWAILHRVYLRGAADHVAVAAALSAPEFQRGPLRKKPTVVLAIVLAGFLVGLPPALIAAVGAALLLITRTVDPRHVYDDVDLGAAGMLHWPVHHRGRRRARGPDGSASSSDRRVEPAPPSTFRPCHRASLQHRQQRPCGNAPSHGDPGPAGSARRLARARALVDAGRQSDHHRIRGEHHRRRARTRRRDPRWFRRICACGRAVDGRYARNRIDLVVGDDMTSRPIRSPDRSLRTGGPAVRRSAVMNGATWSRISLSRDEVAAGHVDRLQDSFAQVLIDASAASGAAMFGAARTDGGEDLYFTPSATAVAEDLLKENGAVPCPPPLNDGDMALLVGEDGDARLLSS